MDVPSFPDNPVDHAYINVYYKGQQRFFFAGMDFTFSGNGNRDDLVSLGIVRVNSIA
jgi:hypothetical protein